MNRRDAIGVMAQIALGAVIITPNSIFFPNIMRNYQVQAQPPTGLGMGVNLNMPYNQQSDALNLALNTLQPSWFHHWRQWPPTARSGFIPLLQPVPNIITGEPAYFVDAATLAAFRNAMANVGVSISNLAWQICNEPEHSGWTANQVAVAMAAQIEVLKGDGIIPLVISPNSNINTLTHLSWWNEWREEAAKQNITYITGIHIYENSIEMLDLAWSRFSATLGPNEKVIVTECGAGNDRPMSEWLRVMPWFYNLLASDSRVQALAPFSAYPFNGTVYGNYPGFMQLDGSLTELGEQWMEIVDK